MKGEGIGTVLCTTVLPVNANSKSIDYVHGPAVKFFAPLVMTL